MEVCASLWYSLSLSLLSMWLSLSNQLPRSTIHRNSSRFNMLWERRGTPLGKVQWQSQGHSGSHRQFGVQIHHCQCYIIRARWVQWRRNLHYSPRQNDQTISGAGSYSSGWFGTRGCRHQVRCEKTLHRFLCLSVERWFAEQANPRECSWLLRIGLKI